VGRDIANTLPLRNALDLAAKMAAH
jgi:hypothetical protein